VKSSPSSTGSAFVPSRSGGVLKTDVSFGYMLLSNCVIRPCTCASVTVVEFGICARQSPAGNAVSLATQTSMWLPTPRSV
jgi:hypothetical protein